MIPSPRSPAQRAAEAYFKHCRQFRISHTMRSAPAMRQQLNRLAELHAAPGLPDWLSARVLRRLSELNEEFRQYLEPR